MTKQEIINAYAHDLAVMAQENKKLNQRVMNLEVEKQQLIQEINRLQETKPKVFGKKQSTTFAKMGDSRYLNLVAKRESLNKDLTKLSHQEFEKQQSLIKRIGKTMAKH